MRRNEEGPKIVRSDVQTTNIDVGAEIYDSEIFPDVAIEAATIELSKIFAGTTIMDGTRVSQSEIGSDCIIGAGCTIENCIIFDDVVIMDGCVLRHCRIVSGSKVDAESHLTHVFLKTKTRIGLRARMPPDFWEKRVSSGSSPPILAEGPGPEFHPQQADSVEASAGIILDRRSTTLGVAERWLRAPASHNLLFDDVHIGAGSQLNGVCIENHAKIGNSCYLSAVQANPYFTCEDNCQFQGVRIHDRVTVESESHVKWTELHDEVLVGPHSQLKGENARAIVFGYHVRAEGFNRIGRGVTVGNGSTLGVEVKIGADSNLGNGCHVGDYAQLDGHNTLGRDVKIGEAVHLDLRVEVGDAASIGNNVTVDQDAIVRRDITIGEEAHIGPDVTVDRDIEPGEDVGLDTGEVASTIIPVSANAEAWLYARLAEIAGDGKLTRDKIKRQRPELLEHPITKELLKTQPKPTGSELAQLAAGAKDATKYRVVQVWHGWTDPMQRLGKNVNDVMRFEMTDDLLDAIVAFADPKWHSMLKESIREYVTANNPHSGTVASEKTLGWVRYFLVPDHDELVIEELQSDLPILRWAMGVPLSKLSTKKPTLRGEMSIPSDLDDAWRKVRGRVPIPLLFDNATGNIVHPMLAESAEALGLDPIPTFEPSVLARHLIPYGAVLEGMRVQFDPHVTESISLARPDARYTEARISRPPPGAERWPIWLKSQALKVDPSTWSLDPEIFTDPVLALMDEDPRWTLAHTIAIDIHNKIMMGALVIFHERRNVRKRVWSEFVIQLHDLYETMLAFMLDWAAGRTVSEDGERAGPQVPLKRIYILTHDTKTRVYGAGTPPLYPYNKLYRRFQSAPKMKLPDYISTSGMEEKHVVTGSEEEGAFALAKPPAATARALRPNDPSIWDER